MIFCIFATITPPPCKLCAWEISIILICYWIHIGSQNLKVFQQPTILVFLDFGIRFFFVTFASFLTQNLWEMSSAGNSNIIIFAVISRAPALLLLLCSLLLLVDGRWWGRSGGSNTRRVAAAADASDVLLRTRNATGAEDRRCAGRASCPCLHWTVRDAVDGKASLCSYHHSSSLSMFENVFCMFETKSVKKTRAVWKSRVCERRNGNSHSCNRCQMSE